MGEILVESLKLPRGSPTDGKRCFTASITIEFLHNKTLQRGQWAILSLKSLITFGRFIAANKSNKTNSGEKNI